MVESRWVRWIGPGVVALGAVGFIASTTLGAGDRPWSPRACTGPPADLISAARDPGPTAPADLRDEAWFRVDPLLDQGGVLRGQRLAVGVGDDADSPAAELPPESFVAGPFGRVILVGADDGATSRLRVFDVASGCAWAVAQEGDVIRRATIDPEGARIYETRVDRTSRADLGVWQRPLDGSAPAQRILAPLPADDRFGRTFTTEFTWDAPGRRLAIQACGEVACRTRIHAPAGGPTAMLDTPDLGLLVGFDGDLVVTYGACRGMPCAIVSTDLATGERHVLDADGGPALLMATGDGVRLIHETRLETRRGLRAVALDGSAAVDLGPLPDGLSPHLPAVYAGAATRLPPGWVLLASDGRLPAERTTPGPLLRRIPDGLTVPLDEATR
jgi:hypothetical protein